MREFQEREAYKERLAEISSTQPVDCLSQLRDSYAPKARSTSRSPPPTDTKPTIPSSFDQDGHPLPLAPLSTLGQAIIGLRYGSDYQDRYLVQVFTLILQCDTLWQMYF